MHGRRHAAHKFGALVEPLFIVGEREELALLKVQQHGVRAIARRLGRSPSTVSHELGRNVATRSGQLHYRATVAQWKGERAAKHPKTTWHALFQCFDAGTMTVVAFCRQESISESSFYRWRWKLLGAPVASAEPVFIDAVA